MAYREFDYPGFFETTSEWLAWAQAEDILLSTAPRLGATCDLCYGAVGIGNGGTPYDYCVHCRRTRRQLKGLVPVSYSEQSGLESLLHRYKDWEEYGWLSAPLAAVISQFIEAHMECITDQYGSIDRWAVVPSGGDRPSSPLQDAIECVTEWPVEWEFDLVEKNRKGRPDRGVLDPSFYRLRDGTSVDGEQILVLDDTWTTGASLGSVAAMLRSEGAESVIGLSLGRQIHPPFGSSQQILESAHQRGFDIDRCVCCA